jgi:Uma2 family endonuclease
MSSSAKRARPTEEPIRPVRLGRPPTYADVEALPEHMRGEIVGGELYVMPRPRPRHAVAQGSLTDELVGPFHKGRGGPGGWLIMPEPELHLEGGGKPIDPDLAGWRRERMPDIPEDAAITLVPDWVCEVLSPSTEEYDRGPKMEVYARYGVKHAWLVDPEERILETYRNDEGAWRSAGRWVSDDKVRAIPFDAIEIELSVLWK